MNRRQFLLASALGLTSVKILHSTLWRELPGPNEEFVTAYGDWPQTFIDKADPSVASHVVFVNPKTMAMEIFDAPFRMHMAVQNPRRPEQLVMISKWGTQICLFDRHLGRVVKVREAGAGRRFFGHAVWDSANDGFWVTEQDDAKYRGLLTLRGADLNVRREVLTGGVFPHEVQMPASGTILVANTGAILPEVNRKNQPLELRTSNMSWIDTSGGHVVRKVEFPAWMESAGASHFSLIPETGELFVGTMAADQRQMTSMMRVKSSGQAIPVVPQEIDKNLFRGEIVSFAYLKDKARVLWTHSKAPGIFSASTNRVSEAELVLAAPARGIIGFGDDVIVAHAERPRLIKWKDGDLGQGHKGPRPFASWGSHMSKIIMI